MVEFIIVFFPLFLLVLLILQESLMLTARHVVNYAAYNAVRSVIVHMQEQDLDPEENYYTKAKRAAAFSCIPITPKIDIKNIFDFGSDYADDLRKFLESMGGETAETAENAANILMKFVVSDMLIDLEIHSADGSSLEPVDGWEKSQVPLTSLKPGDDVTAIVEYKYSLRIPIVNKMIFYGYWYAKAADYLNVDEKMFDALPRFKLPIYYIPIKASSTLTVAGEMKR